MYLLLTILLCLISLILPEAINFVINFPAFGSVYIHLSVVGITCSLLLQAVLFHTAC